MLDNPDFAGLLFSLKKTNQHNILSFLNILVQIIVVFLNLNDKRRYLEAVALIYLERNSTLRRVFDGDLTAKRMCADLVIPLRGQPV